MKLTCYGPRGSLTSPSRKGRKGEPDFITMEYGGNTSCYYLEAGPFRIIFDNGSGVSVLGDELMRKGVIGKHFGVMKSHYHWDHVHGLPFAVPYFIKSNTFHIHGHRPISRQSPLYLQETVESVLAEQQATPHFPVSLGAMPSKRIYTSHSAQFSETFWYYDNGDTYERLDSEAAVETYLSNGLRHDANAGWGVYGDLGLEGVDASKCPHLIKFTTIPLNHPDGCLGYRVDYMGKSMAYCTDSEPARYTNAMINRFCHKVGLIILDGQYTEQQIAGMTQGFGHGTPRSCVEQARAAEADWLLVHHHDPKHDDAKLAEMEQDAHEFAGNNLADGPRLALEFAREGMVYEII